MARLTWWVRLLAALVWMGGCVITSGPQPDPPTHTSVADSAAGCSCGGGPSAPVIELSEELSVATPAAGQVTVRGDAGSVTPGGARVTGINLETADPAVTVASEDDGSFELTLAGEPGDELRLATETDVARSWPVDLLARAEGGAPDRPLPDCLWIEPDSVLWFGELGLGQSARRSLAVINDCTEPATLRLALRVTPVGGFAFAEGTPVEDVTVEPGGSVTVSLDLEPGVEGWADDVVFVELSAPISLRWPISLWGRAVP